MHHMAHQNGINWPPHYDPKNSPVHVRNELNMAAPQKQIWHWLVRATIWSRWYPNCKWLRITEGTGPDLQLETQFTWKTFGVVIRSTILEYEPYVRIAWDGHALGIDVYHAWLLTPSGSTCHVLTEETQHGWLARLSHTVLPNRMYQHHQNWLVEMEYMARTGCPPDF